MSGCQGKILMIISVVQVTGMNEIISYRRKLICINFCLGCTINKRAIYPKIQYCVSLYFTVILFVFNFYSVLPGLIQRIRKLLS